MRRIPARRLIGLALLAVAVLYAAKLTYSIVRWKAYVWLPAYVAGTFRKDDAPPGSDGHLIFVMCDHYEPGYGNEGAHRSAEWLRKFRPIAERHRDSAGNRFRYTWFYPYDHRNERVRDALADEVRAGFGEVELHWHHPPATNETFPAMLDSAITWFREADLLRAGSDTRFAFIHGNWCLDGSSPRCGVTREMDILAGRGCYADFTFSTVGTVAQPRKVNSIYYARDDDAPKSYDSGVDAQVGRPLVEGFMIFEGPTAVSWLGEMEYGAVESYALPDRRRIERWIDAHVHVRGRPEWTFVKVYTHGVQSEAEILDRSLDGMLGDLEDIAARRGLALHYMTAREAYNVVKAAEAGLAGNPETHRDFRIPRPLMAEGP